LKLKKYLRTCITLIDEINPLDNTALREVYVSNDSVIVDEELWGKEDDIISSFARERWDLEDFLKSDQKLIVIGAPYGVGKTSFCLTTASKLASIALENPSNNFIPIYILLKGGLLKIDKNDNSLDDILKLINKDCKILYIFDALDELEEPEKIEELYRTIKDKLNKFYNSKALVTTRFHDAYPRILRFEKYVRLLPWNPSQVDMYFNKSKIDLSYKSVKDIGLQSDEISKPLFCQMLSALYKEKRTIKLTEKTNLNRTLLFFKIIHEVVLGKHRSNAYKYHYRKHQLSEKQILRKIAELKHIYHDKLTKEIIQTSVKLDLNVSQIFERIISSHFYTLSGREYEEKIYFLHKSFVEYLLAEYYIESFLANEPYRINLKILTLEPCYFFQTC